MHRLNQQCQFLLHGMLMVLMGANLEASLQVNFAHGYTGSGTANQNVGQISLAFTVDARGQVTMDASCTDPDPAQIVDSFDGPVGTVDDQSLFNSTFALLIDGVGNLRVDNAGLGLCIQGGNAQRLDAAGEAIRFSFETPDLMADWTAVRYGNSTGGIMDINGAGFAIQSGSGELTVVGLGASSNLLIESSSDQDGQGFVLAGIVFAPMREVQRTTEVGTNLELPEEISLVGSAARYPFSDSDADRLVLGGAATLLTLPDAVGSSPLLLGRAELEIREGARWILDGSNYAGPFVPGARFELARYATFSGTLSGVRHRSFQLPADRNLRLVQSGTALYFEVVEQTPVEGPNIILIYMDDMSGGHHFGFEGRNCLTPTIDALAANGLVFSNAFAASSICSPSRYSVLTGRWPSRNPSPAFMARFPSGSLARLDNVGSELPENTDNIAGWLQALGYRTGFVGKSHLIDHELLNVANWAGGGLIPYASTVDPASNATVNAAMRFNHRVIAQRHQPRGFDFAGGVYLGNLKELYNEYLNRHHQEWLTQYALQFIEENRHQPFFLYMAPTVNHGPVNADLRYSLRANPTYTGEGHVPDADYSFMPSRAEIMDEVNAAGKLEESARETWVDYSVAAILDKLRGYGLLEDTLVVFTADHGHITQLDPDPLSGKSSLYDSGLKVPLVMHWPNGIVAPDTEVTGLVQNVDIAATLLAIAGGESHPLTPIDGLSLDKVLAGTAGSPREVAYAEIGYARAVRTLDWKLISLRYPVSVQRQIEDGARWNDYQTGAPVLPRPYYISNSNLANGPARSYPSYFEDDQLYNLNDGSREFNNRAGEAPTETVALRQLLGVHAGSIPNRPFGEFTRSESGPPAPIADFRFSFLDGNRLQLNWSVGTDVIGYSLAMADDSSEAIIEALPFDATTFAVSIPEGMDGRYVFSAYNAHGSTSRVVDLIDPEVWRQRVLTAHPLLPTASMDWVADPDGDGFSNLIEYAFALDPLSADSFPWPVPQLVSEESGLLMEVPVPWDGRRQVDFSLRWSSDLFAWSVGGPELSLIELGTGGWVARTTQANATKSQFIQIHVQLK